MSLPIADRITRYKAWLNREEMERPMLGLLWEPGQRWRIEPYIDFAAAQDRLSPRDESDPRIRPGGTAGWGSVNLLASWEATTALTLGLKLQNLGDKNYREHGSGIDAAGRNLGIWADVIF